MAKAKPRTANPKPAQPAAAAFEATCPNCGMTADVAGDVEAVRCRGCGTIVQLVDDDLPANAPAPEAAPAPSPPRPVQVIANPGLAIAVGLAGPFLVLVAYATAHAAIDQSEPQTGPAGIWYLITLLMAGGAAFALWPALGTDRVFPGALWALLPAVPMFVVAQAAGTAYDDDGFAWAVLGVPFFAAYLLTMGIIAGVLASRKDGSAAGAVMVGGVGLCLGLGVSAALMLMTLEEQAAEAREAHEAPAWGFLLVVGVLLTLAARRRRSIH